MASFPETYNDLQNVGSARRVTHEAGTPFCDDRVTLLAEPTFCFSKNNSTHFVSKCMKRWLD